MNLIIFPVILHLLSAFLIALFWKKSKNLSGIACFSFSILSLISIILLGKYIILQGRIIYYVGGWEIPIGITLMVDSLSFIFLVVLNLILVIVCGFSIVYMKNYVKYGYFFVLFSLLAAGLNGILISMDFFNIYVFLEIASLASYILVAFGLRTEEVEASFKYTVLGFIGSIMILLGIALILGKTGTLNIADFMVVAQNMDKRELWFILGLFISGFSLKTALFPFHFWLPDAHSLAPAPVSAILSGVFVKITGFYMLTRIVVNIFLMFPESKIILIGLGILSMVFGALMAINQEDIKRVYAYSTISQIGYCAVGIGIGGYYGYLGGLLHFIFHGFSKALLFLNSGTIEYEEKTTKISQLSGLIDKLPYTTTLGSIGMLSISGIPPFGCFWSKIIIIISAIMAGMYGIAFICVAVSIITLGYFLKLQRNVFYNKSNNPERKKENLGLLIPMIFLGILVSLGALVLLPDFKIFLDRAVDVMENFSYIKITEI